MAQRWVRVILRWLATAVMALGVSFFVIGILGAVLVLREGVTGLAGEEDRLPPESAGQIRSRLVIIGGLLLAVV
jgi:hypothetical protein